MCSRAACGATPTGAGVPGENAPEKDCQAFVAMLRVESLASLTDTSSSTAEPGEEAVGNVVRDAEYLAG